MTDQNYEIFINKLKTYYTTKGVNLNYVPKIGNEPINLYKLYNVVQALGGVTKVNDFNKWDIVYEEYGLPKSCVNGCFLVKQVYRRYLESFDKQIKGDNIEVQEDLQLRLNPYKSQFPLSCIYPNHYQFRPNNDISRLCYAHPSASVLQSLLSGFPNEADFAINLISKVASKECLLDEIKHFPSSKKCLDSFSPSERKEFITIQAFLLGLHHNPKPDNLDIILNINKGKQITLLSKAKGLLDILIAHLGVHSNEIMTSNNIKSCLRNSQINQHSCEGKGDLKVFWECSLDEEGLTYFSRTLGNVHGTTSNFCDFLNLPYKFNMCYKNKITRLKQIAEIFRNWSFIETNAQIMVKNHLFFRFIFLAIHCTIGNVKTLALDTLANVSKYINLLELPVLEKIFLLRTLDSCTHSPDRLIMVRGLEILGNLCFTSSNIALLCNEFSPAFFNRLLTLLTISDILIICRTLETLYQISFTGEDLANMLASIPGCIETLINFLTLESGNLMPKPKKSALLLAPHSASTMTTDPVNAPLQAHHLPSVKVPGECKEKNFVKISSQTPQSNHSPQTPLRMREIAKLPDNISLPTLGDSVSDEPKSLMESLAQAKIASRTALAQHFEASRFAEKWFISYYEETDQGCSVLRADVLNCYYINGRRLNNTFRPLKYTSLCNCIKRAFPNAKYSRKLKQDSKQLQVIIHGVKKRAIPITLEEASKIHATHQNWRQLGQAPTVKRGLRKKGRPPTIKKPPPIQKAIIAPVLPQDPVVEIKLEVKESPKSPSNHQSSIAQNTFSPAPNQSINISQPSTFKMSANWALKTTRSSRRIYNYGKVVKKARLCLNNHAATRRPAHWPVKLKKRFKTKPAAQIHDSSIAQPHPPLAAGNTSLGSTDNSKPFESPLLQARLLMTANPTLSNAQLPLSCSPLINQRCNITNGFCESDGPPSSSSISSRNLTTTATKCPIQTAHQDSPISIKLDLSPLTPHPNVLQTRDIQGLPSEETSGLSLPKEPAYGVSGENCEPEPMELEFEDLPTQLNNDDKAIADDAFKIISTTAILLNGPSSCNVTVHSGKSPTQTSSSSVVSHTVNGICARSYFLCHERMANDSLPQPSPNHRRDYDKTSFPQRKGQNSGHSSGDEDVANKLHNDLICDEARPLMNGPLPASGNHEEPPPFTIDDCEKDEMDIDVNDSTGASQIICNSATISSVALVPNGLQLEVKPFDKNPTPDQSSAMKVPPPPLIPLFKCGWANCESTFEKLKSVLSHAYFAHAQKAGGCYWYPCVGRVYRQKLSLATHLQEVHCLPKNLQVVQGYAPAQQPPTSLSQSCPTTSPNTKNEHCNELEPQKTQQPVFNPPDQTALQAIRKHFSTTAAPHLFQCQEDSVTKSIRLIAALILRNLTKNSPRIGKKIIKTYESYLSLNAMNSTEASTVLSQILWELNQ